MKYTLDLPDSLHRQLKIMAAMKGITMKNLVISVISEFIANGGKIPQKP